MSTLAPPAAPPAPAAPAPRPGPSLRAFVGLVMLAVLAVRLSFVTGSLHADEAGYLMVARSWHLHGPDLYGRYFVDRPPLLIALYRLASLVPWDPFVRVLTIPAALVFVGAAAGAAREVAGVRGARWAAVVAAALVVSPALGADEANGEIFAVPFVMLAVWAVLAAVRRPRHRTALALGAGVAAGLAVMVKQNFGDGAVFGTTLLLASVLKGRLPVRTGARIALAAAAGVGVVLLAALGYVALSGVGVGDAVYTLVGFRTAALGVLTGHSVGAPEGRAAVLLGLAAVSGALPLALLLGREGLRRRRRHGWSPAAWAVLVTVLAETVGIVAGGSYWPHYLIQLAPMLALAVGMAAPRVRALRAAALVTVVSALTITLAVDVARASDTPSGGELTGRWIATASRPHDTATVLYGNAEVQEASGLQSPYPYLWSLPMRTLDPHLGLLRATLVGPVAPTWVVVWDHLDPWGIDAHGRTRLTLATHYHRAGTVCGHQVWLRDGVHRQLPPLPDC